MKSCTTIIDGKDRAAWFAERRNWITATMPAAIIGSALYSKIIDVWNERTDPDYISPERDRFLSGRADHGTEREPFMVAWASEHLGGVYKPNVALVQTLNVENEYGNAEGYAVTPDGFRYRRGSNRPRLIECKTTGKDWREVGVPLYILDQVYTQYVATDAEHIDLVVELWEWPSPTDPGKHLDTFSIPVTFDPVRWAVLDKWVQWYKALERDGIAPESDLYLAEPEPIEFDDDEETVAAKLARAAEFEELGNMAEEYAQIVARQADDEARRKVLEAKLKAAPKEYDGRRVHLHAQHLRIELRRTTRAKHSWDDVPENVLRQVTTYEEQETATLVVDKGWLTDERKRLREAREAAKTTTETTTENEEIPA